MRKIIVLLLIIVSSGALRAQISQAEYFIDVDPGIGNATKIENMATVIENNNNNIFERLSFTAPLSTLTDGFHRLYVRARNGNAWSQTQSVSFLKMRLPGEASMAVSQVEYFIDADPGQGNGIAIPVGEAFVAPIDLLPNGFHTLYIRAKNENGWSQTQSHSFVKIELRGEETSLIDYLEYFVDMDPGYGNGIAVELGDNTETFSFVVDTKELLDGFHTLYVRAKNKGQYWSQVMHQSFVKTVLPTEIASGLKLLEYYLNVDPGVGEGIQVAVSTSEPDLNFNVDLNQVPEGNHVLYIRGLNRIDQWNNIGQHGFAVIGGNSLESISELDLSVYPNPATDFVLIKNETASITMVTLTDSRGIVLLQEQVNKATPLINIPVASYGAGIYFLRIEVDGSSKVVKLMKK